MSGYTGSTSPQGSTGSTPNNGTTGIKSTFNMDCLYFDIQSPLAYTINSFTAPNAPLCDATFTLQMSLSDFHNNLGFISAVELVAGVTGGPQQNLVGFFGNISAALQGNSVTGATLSNQHILDTSELESLTITPNNCVIASDARSGTNNNDMIAVLCAAPSSTAASAAVVPASGTWYIPEYYISDVAYHVAMTPLATALMDNASTANKSLMDALNGELINMIQSAQLQ